MRMRKKKHGYILPLALMVGAAALGTLLPAMLPARPQPARGVAEDMNRTIARLSAAMESIELPPEAMGAEMIVPVKYLDADGNLVMVLYNYRFLGEQESILLYEHIPDPALAEEREACQVGDYPATYYRAGEWDYLLWQSGEDLLLALQYNPAVLPREEAIQIAASCRTVPAR